MLHACMGVLVHLLGNNLRPATQLEQCCAASSRKLHNHKIRERLYDSYVFPFGCHSAVRNFRTVAMMRPVRARSARPDFGYIRERNLTGASGRHTISTLRYCCCCRHDVQIYLCSNNNNIARILYFCLKHFRNGSFAQTLRHARTPQTSKMMKAIRQPLFPKTWFHGGRLMVLYAF